jgi:hypothetical protein
MHHRGAAPDDAQVIGIVVSELCRCVAACMNKPGDSPPMVTPSPMVAIYPWHDE